VSEFHAYLVEIQRVMVAELCVVAADAQTARDEALRIVEWDDFDSGGDEVWVRPIPVAEIPDQTRVRTVGEWGTDDIWGDEAKTLLLNRDGAE